MKHAHDDPTRERPARTRDPVAKRRQITAAAIKLFARQGFERTTTREIAQAAGIAEGTIYVHFATKHDILFEFFKSHALEPVFAILSDSACQDEYDVLRALVRNRVEMFGKLRDVARVMFGEAIFNPKVAGLLCRELHVGVDRIKLFVEERMRSGRFRQLDPEAVARLIMSMFFGTFILWGFIAGDFPKRFTPAQLEATLPEFILHGLMVSTPATTLAPSRPARARLNAGPAKTTGTASGSAAKRRGASCARKKTKPVMPNGTRKCQ